MRDQRDDREGTAQGGATGSGEGAAMLPGDEVPPGSPASGEHLCRACRGAGQRDDGTPCPDCDGTGHVIVAIAAGP